MSKPFKCRICQTSFGSVQALKSHQTFKHKNHRGPVLTESSPLFRFFKPRQPDPEPDEPFPEVEEPQAENVSTSAAKRNRKRKGLKWKDSELKITSEVVDGAVDRRTPEYRQKFARILTAWRADITRFRARTMLTQTLIDCSCARFNDSSTEEEATRFFRKAAILERGSQEKAGTRSELYSIEEEEDRGKVLDPWTSLVTIPFGPG